MKHDVLSVSYEPVSSTQFRALGLGSEKFTPFEKSDVPEIFESCSAFDVSLMIDVIVDRRMDRSGFRLKKPCEVTSY